jgi:hypothetical protein
LTYYILFVPDANGDSQATVFSIIEAGYREVFSKSAFGLALLLTYDTAMRASLDNVSAVFRTWFNGARANDGDSIMQGCGSGNFSSNNALCRVVEIIGNYARLDQSAICALCAPIPFASFTNTTIGSL